MRKLTGWTATAVSLWAAVAAGFHLYTASIGYLEPRIQRSLSLLFLLPLVFFLYPARKGKSPDHRPSVPDLLLAVASLAPNWYSYVEAHRINLRLEEITPLLPAELWLGTLATLLILEGVRRAVTPVLTGIMAVAIGYLFVCEYLPGMFNFPNIRFSEIVETMYLINGQGIYGPITGIAATLVAIFIAFGSFIEGSGVGRLFANLGNRVAGRYSGGPAKVAVITSAMTGMMSGSSTSNVFTTGSFTIPMMKKLGYRPAFAGGVEVSASVGGQIMPPVMGTGAFIMSEITNIPYSQIIVSAALGAVAYYLMVFISVHLEAIKNGLRGMAEEDLPPWRDVLRDIHLLLPIVVLVVLLAAGFSAHFSALYSIFAAVGLSWFRKDTRMGPRKLLTALVSAGQNTASVAIACVGAGIVVACLTKTGLILSLGSIIATLAGGQLWIAGGLLLITCLIMGMGVPTSAAYIITAAIGAPTLITDFGVPPLAAHLFVFYFAILAEATPPVSIASYAAASLAQASYVHTGIHAVRLSAAGFVIGYGFLFSQGILLMEPLLDVISEFIELMGGVCILAAAFRGYWRDHIGMPFRLILVPLGFWLPLFEGYSDWVHIALELLVLAPLTLFPGFFRWGTSQRALEGRALD